MERRTIRIAVMFHNLLNLHGDRGNILALKKIADAGDVEAIIEYIDFSTEDFHAENFDIIIFGPGELSYFKAIKEWMLPQKKDFEDFIDKGRILLAIGTTTALFGGVTLRTDGTKFEGLSFLDCSFKEREYVYGNDLHYRVAYNGKNMEIFGTQIQMMDIESNEPAFGDMIYGRGNSEASKQEGMLIKDSIFTNTLGPMLALNPWLTKEIINTALKNKEMPEISAEIDMSLEEESLEAKKRFTDKKPK